MSVVLSLLFFGVKTTLGIVVAVLTSRARWLLLAAVGIDLLVAASSWVFESSASPGMAAVRIIGSGAASIVSLALVAAGLARELAPPAPAVGPDNPYAALGRPAGPEPGQPCAPGHPSPILSAPRPSAPPYGPAGPGAHEGPGAVPAGQYGPQHPAGPGPIHPTQAPPGPGGQAAGPSPGQAPPAP